MFDAVSKIVMPKLEVTWEFRTRSTPMEPCEASSPEDISSLAVPPLQDFRSQVELVSFSLEPSAAFHSQFGGWGRRPRPHRSHPKVPNLQPSLARNKHVGRLQVEVDDPSVMDKLQAL